jgi:hypothetical protein
LVTDVEFLRATDRLVQEIRPTVHNGLAVLALQSDTTRNRQEFRASLSFDLAPKFIGTQDQRHVCLAIADCLADDSTLTVRRAVSMRWGEPIAAEHLVAPSGQLVNRGASGGAKTDYDRIKLIAHDSRLSTLIPA